MTGAAFSLSGGVFPGGTGTVNDQGSTYPFCGPAPYQLTGGASCVIAVQYIALSPGTQVGQLNLPLQNATATNLSRSVFKTRRDLLNSASSPSPTIRSAAATAACRCMHFGTVASSSTSSVYLFLSNSGAVGVPLTDRGFIGTGFGYSTGTFPGGAPGSQVQIDGEDVHRSVRPRAARSLRVSSASSRSRTSRRARLPRARPSPSGSPTATATSLTYVLQRNTHDARDRLAQRLSELWPQRRLGHSDARLRCRRAAQHEHRRVVRSEQRPRGGDADRPGPDGRTVRLYDRRVSRRASRLCDDVRQSEALPRVGRQPACGHHVRHLARVHGVGGGLTERLHRARRRGRHRHVARLQLHGRAYEPRDRQHHRLSSVRLAVRHAHP